VGPSEDYIKYGLIPEAYAGVSVTTPHFLARVGTDFISLKPRHQVLEGTWTHDKGTKVKDRIYMFSPYIYLQVTDGGLLKINAKSVLAQGGDHMRLMSGYAVYDTSDELNWKYTPLQSSVSYVSFCYGSKWQLMCMVGYMKALGTIKSLPQNSEGFAYPENIYYFSNGFKNINQMVRVTPTLAYNAGKLQVAVEYDNTCVDYGNINKLSAHGLATWENHLVINHRILGVVKFAF